MIKIALLPLDEKQLLGIINYIELTLPKFDFYVEKPIRKKSNIVSEFCYTLFVKKASKNNIEKILNTIELTSLKFYDVNLKVYNLK